MTDLLSQLDFPGPAVPRQLVPQDPGQLPAVEVEVLVVGGGVAGLSAAIESAQRCSTLVVLKEGPKDTATAWAQGGIAAALADDDDVGQHVEDTCRVAAGLAHRSVVETVIGAGPALVDRWLSWGGEFDRDDHGRLALALEGGHRRARVIHARGDQTGLEIQELLIRKAAALPRLSVEPATFVLDLITDGQTVRGVLAWSKERGYHSIWAGSIILCNGGVGQVFRETSNPPSATGDGFAMSYRAGALMRGMEFVQFHPTVLYVAGSGRILVSETARGEGGILVDRTGHRFMPDYHKDAELAPRDVVSRAIMKHLGLVRDTHVYLDMRHLSSSFLSHRFPVIHGACLDFGIDMAKDLIPVHPACHYMVGGVQTNDFGETSLDGLYACGEMASSGFHGANRMGSNSLLEGAVLGFRAGQHASENARPIQRTWDAEVAEMSPLPGSLDLRDMDNALRSLMWRLVGIERDADGLGAADRRLAGWSRVMGQRTLRDPFGWSLTNKIQVARLITQAALTRGESRGTHFRRDIPELNDAEWQRDLSQVRPGTK
ncbi:MAG: L-aspartate oxidase [Pseudohongiellaceae bacterium]|jgi:L-aspartate oxidase